MKHLLLTLNLLLATSFLAAPAIAKAKEDSKRERALFKQLDLSKEQKTKLKAVRESRKQKMKALKETKKESRKNFDDALRSDADDSKLKNLHKTMISSMQTFKEYRFETMLETRKILTDSQRKKFNELKGKR